MADSLNNYKPNSHGYKEAQQEKEAEKKRVEKVVTGKVTTKKKSAISKFAEEFISEDAKNIKSYIFGEVLFPALKKAIYDIVIDGTDMILYGGSKQGRKRSTADKVSYVNYYDRTSREPRDNRVSTATRYSYDDIILDSRAEAEEVLERMDELIAAYGLVRVADLYDLVGITGNYTDNKYGWTSLRTAQIVRTGDGGYLIKMPRAIPID